MKKSNLLLRGLGGFAIVLGIKLSILWTIVEIVMVLVSDHTFNWYSVVSIPVTIILFFIYMLVQSILLALKHKRQ